jgi:hypothetical protein
VLARRAKRPASSIARMDEAVIGKVTAGSLVRVKLSTPEGKIVYSDEHRLIGASYPLADDQQEVLRENSVEAELSDLSAPENRFERDQGRLLEVYLPVPTPGGQTLLFETYSRRGYVKRSFWRISGTPRAHAHLLVRLRRCPHKTARVPTVAWKAMFDADPRERRRQPASVQA